MNVTCPYCDRAAMLVPGREIYPHRADLHHREFWSCPPCGAYVGCHENTANPLGRLANAELRVAKVQAHAAFDPLWRDGQMKRKAAYRWLAQQLGIEFKACHIGWFDVEQCRRVVEVCGSMDRCRSERVNA